MKTIRYIVSAIVLAAGLIACQQENMQPQNLSDGNEVEVAFDVMFPEPISVETKSPMGEGPEELNLVLCLYGAGDGYVQNWIPATLISTITDDNGYITRARYSVKLPVTDEPRTVHLFANAPSLEMVDYIDVIMEHMVSTDNDGAFWQEVSLPHIKKLANGSVDPASVRPLTNGVYLVRNFAKFVVYSAVQGDDDYAHFQLKRWALINVPTSGYVAPYTGDAANRFPGGFLNVKDYIGEDGTLTGSALYANLKDADRYLGYIPASDTPINSEYPGDPSDDPASDPIYAANNGAQYMYERPLPTTDQRQTSILIEIEFDGEHELAEDGEPVTYWYKMEILDESGAYLPFLRDFVYNVKIVGLDIVGYDTAQEAFNGPYFGNISASLETAGLNEIANKTSMIHVDQMDYTFLTGGTSEILTKPGSDVPAQFWFKTGDSDFLYETTAGVCIITTELIPVDGFEPAITVFQVNTGVITVNLAETSETQVKKSIIRVSGKPDAANGKTIYREITINLMTTQDFVHGSDNTSITTVPDDLDAPGQEVGITLWLPEGLGSSVFPIQVRIEAENNTLTANSIDLPVKTGPSDFDSSRNTFYFIYTIKYSDYCQLNPRTRKYEYKYDFPLTFYTSKNGDNSTRIKIRDLKGDFNTTDLTLGTVTP